MNITILDKYGFYVGEIIKISADHMAGMKGAIGIIDKPPTGTPEGCYMVDYKPTNSSSIVRNHKWVDYQEIDKASTGTQFNDSGSSMKM